MVSRLSGLSRRQFLAIFSSTAAAIGLTACSAPAPTSPAQATSAPAAAQPTAPAAAKPTTAPAPAAQATAAPAAQATTPPAAQATTAPAAAAPTTEASTTLNATERSQLDAAWNELLKAPGTLDPAWKGNSITVTVIGSGPKGGISGPLWQSKPYWEKLTGATINIAEVPFGDAHTKWFTDLQTGAGRYDVFYIPAWFLGDMVAGQYIIEISKFFDDAKFPKWDRDSLAPQMKELLTWGNDWYGIHNDSDCHTLDYRLDIWKDPKWQQQFKSEKGYDLPSPPRTWDQVLDLATFFNGKDLNGTGEQGFGVTLPLKVGEQGFFHFVSLSAPYSVLPGNNGKPDKYHNVYWFDPDTMEPLINTPGNQRAIEQMQKLVATGPSAMKSWSLQEGWNAYLTGKAAMVWSWGDVGALAEDPAFSKIKGKFGSSGMPGTMEVYDRQANAWQKLDKPNLVSNSIGGSWYPVISKMSKNQDLAYHWAASQAFTAINLWNVRWGWTGVNPGNSYDWLAPVGTSKVEDWVAATWDASDTAQYLTAHKENFFDYTVRQPYLRIPGTFEYWTQLDIHLSELWSGQTDAQGALQRTAEDWTNITDKYGKDQQLKLYQQTLGYTP